MMLSIELLLIFGLAELSPNDEGENFAKIGGDWEKSMAVSSVNGNDLVRWWQMGTGWMANGFPLVLLAFPTVDGAFWLLITLRLEFCGNENALWWQIVDEDDDVDITKSNKK